MADYLTNTTDLTKVANAIRTKGGTTEPLTYPDEFVTAIQDISGGGGDGKWVRPSSWPDLSKMDVSAGDVVYMTSYADEGRGFCNIQVNCTGSYTVEVGIITGSTFTAESTHSVASGNRCRLYYGSANGTYKVLRVTGTNITYFGLGGVESTITIDTFKGYSCNNGIIDVVGNLPSCSGMNHSYCYNLINMKIDGVVLSGSAANIFKYCTSLTSLDASNWDTSAVTTTSGMFQYCYSLTSLDVSGWDTSALTTTSYMFQYCYSLTSLDVSDWDTSALTNTSNMFPSCYSLTSLDVANWNTSAVTNIENMFNNCYSLTSLDVSNWNTSAVTNMSGIFNGCYSLTSLDVSNWNTSAVTNMYYMFGSCHSLASLDVSNWNTSAVKNMSYMFYCCYSLTSLDVSDWDTSAVTTTSYMFQYCYSLTSLDISGWNFSKATTSSNTSSMFRYCKGLHGSITIPASITQIGTYYLGDTRSLYEYHFLSTTPPALANANAFSNMSDFGGKKIYVPAASLEAYKTATRWSTYASYMVGE